MPASTKVSCEYFYWLSVFRMAPLRAMKRGCVDSWSSSTSGGSPGTELTVRFKVRVTPPMAGLSFPDDNGRHALLPKTPTEASRSERLEGTRLSAALQVLAVHSN
ncbi:hypothetical protein VTN02DRAFT_1866 [Thermoascus thermophilus]